MIEKLDRLQGRDIYENTALAKINELCDVVNTIQKEREAEKFEIQEWIGILEEMRKCINTHEKQIGELQKPEKYETPTAKTPEEFKWIGCICRFWFSDSNDTILDYLKDIKVGKNGFEYYGKECGDWFPHCEPVKPDDNNIYKGDRIVI